MREPDDALGLSDIASGALCDARRGKNTIHRLVFRQSVYGRLAGYEDVNDADRPALDRVNRPGTLTNGTITSTMYNLLSVMSVERHPLFWP